MAFGANFLQTMRDMRDNLTGLPSNIFERSMDYQVEADWHLLNTCNYRCDVSAKLAICRRSSVMPNDAVSVPRTQATFGA